MRWVSTQVQHGSFLLSRSGSHFAMWDDQQVYIRGLLKFLDAIDQGAQAVTF
jgi:proline iminopeptidase